MVIAILVQWNPGCWCQSYSSFPFETPFAGRPGNLRNLGIRLPSRYASIYILYESVHQIRQLRGKFRRLNRCHPLKKDSTA
jgi:hypothetical protein